MIEENKSKTKVIMIGGYGQRNLTPYSFLTYQYFVLTFIEKNLKTIEKKLIYNKTIPININAPTRNLGITKIRKKIADGSL